MKNLRSLLVVGAGVLTLSLASLVPFTASWSEDRDPEGLATVTGTVESAEEDENGFATRVYIEADDYDYLVAAEGAGADLVDHVGDRVEATGRVSDSDDKADFDYLLYVESFTVLDGD